MYVCSKKGIVFVMYMFVSKESFFVSKTLCFLSQYAIHIFWMSCFVSLPFHDPGWDMMGSISSELAESLRGDWLKNGLSGLPGCRSTRA